MSKKPTLLIGSLVNLPIRPRQPRVGLSRIECRLASSAQNPPNVIVVGQVLGIQALLACEPSTIRAVDRERVSASWFPAACTLAASGAIVGFGARAAGILGRLPRFEQARSGKSPLRVHRPRSEMLIGVAFGLAVGRIYRLQKDVQQTLMGRSVLRQPSPLRYVGRNPGDSGLCGGRADMPYYQCPKNTALQRLLSRPRSAPV